MEFHGDNQLSIVMKADGQTAIVDLTRDGAGPDAANPVLRERVSNREMQGRQVEARYLFYPEGRAPSSLPHQSIRIISRQDTNMRLELLDQPPTEGKFLIKGDVLTTANSSGGFARY